MNIKVKRLTETATIPTKAHPTDACFDIYADCPDAAHLETVIDFDDVISKEKKGIIIEPGESVKINTGFATEIPEGYFAAVFPRSGMGIKRHLRLSNSTGIIDSSYRGEWIISLFNESKSSQIINHSDRIAQFAILPVPDVTLEETNELDETERGSGGFGSTGK